MSQNNINLIKIRYNYDIFKCLVRITLLTSTQTSSVQLWQKDRAKLVQFKPKCRWLTGKKKLVDLLYCLGLLPIIVYILCIVKWKIGFREMENSRERKAIVEVCEEQYM